MANLHSSASPIGSATSSSDPTSSSEYATTYFSTASAPSSSPLALKNSPGLHNRPPPLNQFVAAPPPSHPASHAPIPPMVIYAIAAVTGFLLLLAGLLLVSCARSKKNYHARKFSLPLTPDVVMAEGSPKLHFALTLDKVDTIDYMNSPRTWEGFQGKVILNSPRAKLLCFGPASPGSDYDSAMPDHLSSLPVALLTGNLTRCKHSPCVNMSPSPSLQQLPIKSPALRGKPLSTPAEANIQLQEIINQMKLQNFGECEGGGSPETVE